MEEDPLDLCGRSVALGVLLSIAAMLLAKMAIRVVQVRNLPSSLTTNLQTGPNPLRTANMLQTVLGPWVFEPPFPDLPS
jgi:hypothetical protein